MQSMSQFSLRLLNQIMKGMRDELFSDTSLLDDVSALLSASEINLKDSGSEFFKQIALNICAMKGERAEFY